MDATKELCSDNRHRIYIHCGAFGALSYLVFGHAIINSVGKVVNVKDLCEQDHILPDYQNRFIPTFGDFVEAMDYQDDPVLMELLIPKVPNIE